MNNVKDNITVPNHNYSIFLSDLNLSPMLLFQNENSFWAIMS